MLWEPSRGCDLTGGLPAEPQSPEWQVGGEGRNSQALLLAEPIRSQKTRSFGTCHLWRPASSGADNESGRAGDKWRRAGTYVVPD